MTAKWLAVVIGSTLLLAAGIVVSVRFFMEESRPSVLRKYDALEELLHTGDRQWNAQDHFAAIATYKTFLQRKEGHHYEWRDDYPRIYRRVIEHEAKYGDPGEAVDWIVKARFDRYVGERLVLHAPEAKALLEQVKQQNQLRR